MLVSSKKKNLPVFGNCDKYRVSPCIFYARQSCGFSAKLLQEKRQGRHCRLRRLMFYLEEKTEDPAMRVGQAGVNRLSKYL